MGRRRNGNICHIYMHKVSMEKRLSTSSELLLVQEAADKSALVNCNLGEIAIGTSHIVWESVNNNTIDVKMGITKTRMLTGVYMLQSI